MKDCNAIILAAGKGTRMLSELPKCAYPFYGKPMIVYIINMCKKIQIDDICVVVGHKKESIENLLQDKVKYAYQKEQLGTANAVLAAKDFLERHNEGITLIFPGDMPLIDGDVINNLIREHIENNNDLTILTTQIKNPTGYGRIIRQDGQIIKIIEEKDADDSVKAINEINTGLYCITTNLLEKALSKVDNNNNKGEYYLTDIVKILSGDKKVKAYLTEYDFKLTGINDLYTLSLVEKEYQKYINRNWMDKGVHLINPDSIIIEDEVKIDANVTIDAFSIIRGKTTIMKDTYIPPYSLIINNIKIK
ncbi:bifunctional protein GlmU [Staphylococcus sp. CAG:324]|nr:bifunctional N-acetylglucosamine-1-phosphate uridyltransferase/glucosamine-1-phosphate acetyltransferase [Bacilli bacterium]CDC70493.1 bifunctional protein GlmU [Staphylococcus sp. CAG:324]